MFENPEVKQKSRRVGRPFKNDLVDNVDKRKLILKKSRQLFLDLPYEKVSIRKIAKASNVSPGLICYYFINKEGVFAAFLEDMALEQQDRFFEYNPSTHGNNMTSLMDAHLALMRQEPNVVKLFYKAFATDNESERSMIIDHFIRPNDEFIKSKLHPKKSKQEAMYAGFMPGLMFTSALMQCLDEENRDKIFPLNFEMDLRRSIHNMNCDF